MCVYKEKEWAKDHLIKFVVKEPVPNTSKYELTTASKYYFEVLPTKVILRGSGVLEGRLLIRVFDPSRSLLPRGLVSPPLPNNGAHSMID